MEGALAVASSAPGRIDLFARAPGGAFGSPGIAFPAGALLHAVFEKNTIGSFRRLGGPRGGFLGAAGLSAVSWGPGRIDVVAQGPGGAVEHAYRDTDGFWKLER